MSDMTPDALRAIRVMASSWSSVQYCKKQLALAEQCLREEEERLSVATTRVKVLCTGVGSFTSHQELGDDIIVEVSGFEDPKIYKLPRKEEKT